MYFTDQCRKGIECYVDTDFAGGWAQEDHDNTENVISRTGYVIKYAFHMELQGSSCYVKLSSGTSTTININVCSPVRTVFQ